jgi:N-methylhydantoinase A/oxoprolinase/acetone carboxylase beta subunit
MKYRIGIDVGGTNTDAVLLDEQLKVAYEVKSPTTADVSSGIFEALRSVVQGSGVNPHEVRYAMLGTTHCTNAIVERKRLNRVGAIRIGKPATTAVRPMMGWPEDLRAAVGENWQIVSGGYEYDGRTIVPLDEEEIRQVCRSMKGRIETVAISGVFSPANAEQEKRAAAIVREELGESVSISVSHEIGSIGLLERENATILNAALIETAKMVAEGFREALKKNGIENAGIYFGQNDGTLMSLEYAIRYPILTIACGPTNSIRGAAHLSGRKDGLVVDVGGTTTDIGVLVNGFPRQSSLAVDIGGIRTNFRMPDILSVAIGGGTIVRREGDTIKLGPDSVGYQLHNKALINGGDTMTATDVAVAMGRLQWPGAQLDGIDRELCKKVDQKLVADVEDAIDRMKTSPTPVPVILVGGGSVLLPDQMKGVSEVIRPKHFGAANAIGAALGQVSGQIEKIYSLDEMTREEALEEARMGAVHEATAAGADPATIEIVHLEDIPLAYLPGNAILIRVKAAGLLQA